MSITQLKSDISRKSSKKKLAPPRQEIPGLNSTKTTSLHRRIALFISIVLILACLVAYRYAAISGPTQPAFAVIFTVLTIFAALLTADLLLGQFLSTRLPSLAVLGGIYLYVCLINISYLLTLPKAFSPYGLFNAGLYAPSWLWIFWQVGYSCGIFVYVLIEKRYTKVQLSQQMTKRVFLFLVLAIFLLVLIFSVVAIDPYHLLPDILNRNPPPVFLPFVSIIVFGANSVMCVSAFFLLRSHSVLHLWLRVSILASFINVSLSLYGSGRYSIGWYVSRIDGLMTAIFVLYALLHEINKMYMWLAVQNEKLAQQNRIQSDFLSVVGHEFRTALTGILGFSEMIREGNLDGEDAQEYADDIHNDAIRLTRLINDLLDMERMKSGRVEMNWEPLAINEFVRGIVERTFIGSQRGQIQLELDERIPIIQADGDKLTQVFTNLITNAIKYSPEGGTILVRSKWENGTVHFCVQDHGIGIPEEKIEQIFERYTRVESNATRYIGGTGLGLPIVRQIVEMHNGNVWVESNLGEGSTFHVEIPAWPLPEMEEAQRRL
ncbi:MAG: HAMP domain-containing histidine kinase [Ktedonobacteraceae bacterium]|nr:HAMP domain-containing histidine kinase [Ktedonobacteraceae bacterium]